MLYRRTIVPLPPTMRLGVWYCRPTLQTMVLPILCYRKKPAPCASAKSTGAGAGGARRARRPISIWQCCPGFRHVIICSVRRTSITIQLYTSLAPPLPPSTTIPPTTTRYHIITIMTIFVFSMALSLYDSGFHEYFLPLCGSAYRVALTFLLIFKNYLNVLMVF